MTKGALTGHGNGKLLEDFSHLCTYKDPSPAACEMGWRGKDGSWESSRKAPAGTPGQGGAGYHALEWRQSGGEKTSSDRCGGRNQKNS